MQKMSVCRSGPKFGLMHSGKDRKSVLTKAAAALQRDDLIGYIITSANTVPYNADGATSRGYSLETMIYQITWKTR